MTKEDVLRELPLKKRLGEVYTWDEFLELERIVKTQRCSATDLVFIKKEIVAKRESLGLFAGLNRRRLVDGEFRYVQADK